MPDPEVTAIVGENRDTEETLIVVFLRGGADGLNLVPPLGDDDYYRARLAIGINSRDAVKIGDFFGLNPKLKDLGPLYSDGLMSIVHCAGSEDQTRSHFEAQDRMEHGGLVAGGWLGRYLLARQPGGGDRSPLSAVAIGSTLPECLRGAPSATAIRSLNDFALGKKTDKVRELLGQLYSTSPSPMLQLAGSSTMKALQRIDRLTSSLYSPANQAVYAEDSFSSGMRQIAQLIKARVGLEAAAIDLGGWDSHLTQSAVMDPEMTKLNAGLAAFCKDMGHKSMERTTIVVMTEFGRRVKENSALGTDHGRGSVMFVLGGDHKGGQVYVDWPGLTSKVLEGPGDLPVLNDYRNVLAPLLKKSSPHVSLEAVFPEFHPEHLEISA